MTAMPYTYKYPRAALTVDCVVFGFDEGELKVLLIQRGAGTVQRDSGRCPAASCAWTKPLDDAARRELAEEAGLKNVFLEQLYTSADSAATRANAS